MSTLDQAYQTQIQNIQKKTGKTLDELAALIKNSGLTKHGELREMLMRDLNLGHGDANSLVHYVQETDGARAAQVKGLSPDAVLDEIYTDKKAPLRPIHDKLMEAINQFGEFEIAPKKGYVSLRRKKQFAMIGPGSSTRVDVGINAKGLDADARLVEQPAGGMCNYKVKVTDPGEVDATLITWLEKAYQSAG